MNSDKESKTSEEPIDALTTIKNVVKKLVPALSEATKSMGQLGRMQPKESKGSHWGSKNKNQKRNKKRFLMAKKSNRINRQRIKGWKY